MNLLFVIDDLYSGGAQRQIVNLAIVMVKLGYNIEMAIYHDRDFYGELLKRNHIKVTKLIARNPIKRILTFRKYIRTGDFDVVISFLGVPNFICELATIPSKKWKLIVNERSADPFILKSFKSIFRRIFHFFADVIVCNSYANKSIIKKVNPFLKDAKIKVVYNILNTEEWIPASDFKFRQDGRLHILVAASHRNLKNFMGLLKGIMLLTKSEREQIRISWYGNNLIAPFYDQSIIESKNFIQQNSLEHMINLYPATHSIREKMQYADVIGLFSFFEGLPNSVCEGMALGKPILASAVSDIPLLVKDELNGKLFNPTDIQSIAHAIRFFIQLNDIDLRKMGDLNVEKAKDLFNESKIVSKFLEIIK